MRSSRIARQSIAILLLSASSAVAQDDFLNRSLGELDWIGDSPFETAQTLESFRVYAGSVPRVILAGDTESYLGIPWMVRFGRGELLIEDLPLSLRVEPGETVTGTLILPGDDGGTRHAFELSTDDADPGGFVDFQRSRFLHNSWHHTWGVPGAAWYRSQADHAQRQLAVQGVTVAFDPDRALFPDRGNRHGIDDAYNLFSGGRALSENLALEEVLEPAQGNAGWKPIGDIAGVTTTAYEWEALVKGIDPTLDVLAAAIPHDQHAVFFPGIQALASVLDEGQAHGLPMLELFEGRSEDARTRERYEAQLCLPLDIAAKTLGPLVVHQVALTGSDPYLRTGSDVAVLLAPRQAPELLLAWIEGQYASALARPGVKRLSGESSGVAWKAVRSLDRSTCSYLAQVGGAVVVTNSLAQLDRIVQVSQGTLEPMASLDEYRFFRDRYGIGDEDESALLILSDATIRRLCGPKWRIGAARRTRAAALIAQEEARLIEEAFGVEAPAKARLVADDIRVPGGGGMRVDEGRVVSDTFGTSQFLTPILELDMPRVTTDEAQAYDRFRARYEARWNDVLDPAAIRIGVTEDALEFDLSIRPLIMRSDYREMRDLTAGAVLAPNSGDPNEHAFFTFAFALDPESEMFRSTEGLLSTLVPDLAKPLGWVGGSVEVYLEAGTWWDRAMAAEDLEEYLDQNGINTPIGVRVSSESPFRLAGFMAAVRSFIEGAAPGLLEWQSREHHGQKYVALIASEVRTPDADLEIYYVTLPEALVLSLDETVVQHAIERSLGSGEAEEGVGEAEPFVPTPWMGESTAMRAGAMFPEMLGAWWKTFHADALQRHSWNALPILTEWHERFPGCDPVAFHTEHFGVRLVCPGGGAYRWNEDWGTMESTVFGHPGEPRVAIVLPPVLRTLKGIDMGLTFEDDGVRARGRLGRRH